MFLSDAALQKELSVLGFSFPLRFLAALGCAALGVALWVLLKDTLLPSLARAAERRSRPGWQILFSAFTKPGSMLALLAMLWIAAQMLGLTAGIITHVFRALAILLAAWGCWSSSSICGVLLHQFAPSSSDPGTLHTIDSFLSNLWKALIAAFAAICALDLFGFNVTSLITGLGLIGLTVSLAAQDTASNFFSGLVIVLERPFTVDDWVVIGSVEGKVEQVTFRSTRIRTLDNTLVTLSNSSVCSGVIQNYTRRTSRLYSFTLGVTYGTTVDMLNSLMADIEAMLKNDAHVVPGTVNVKLQGFGDSSIDILIRCQVDTLDVPGYLKLQNDMNLNLMRLMEKNSCAFAFPSTSVYIEQTGPQPQAQK